MIETKSRPCRTPNCPQQISSCRSKQFLQDFESIFSARYVHSGCLNRGCWGMDGRACSTSLLDGRKRGLPRTSRAAGTGARRSFGALLQSSKVSIVAQRQREMSNRLKGSRLHQSRRGTKLRLLARPSTLSCWPCATSVPIVGDRRRHLVDDATMTTLEYVYHRIDDQQIGS